MLNVSFFAKSDLKDVDDYEKIRGELESDIDAIDLWVSKSYYLKKIKSIIKQINVPITPYSLIDFG